MAKLGSAHVVSERGESGGGSRKKKLEALTVFSQRIQAREREKRRKGEEVKGGAGSPGTSLARETRRQMEGREKQDEVK